MCTGGANGIKCYALLFREECLVQGESFVHEIPRLSRSRVLSQGTAEEEGEEEEGAGGLRTCVLWMSITPRPDAAKPASCASNVRAVQCGGR